MMSTSSSGKLQPGIALPLSMGRIWIELFTKATLGAVALGLMAGAAVFLFS